MSSINKHDKKTTNVINRTTSESLRMGDAEPNLGIRVMPLPTSASTASSRKKIQNSSSNSFQITGVSLTRIELGDDSADDFDESHTDDISRVTDNETPSFSEDSRDTDDHPGYDVFPAPTVTLMVPTEIQLKPPDDKGESGGRFKVVKIPSVIPFSRGRWTCFDYIDNSDPSLNVTACPSQELLANMQAVETQQTQQVCAASSSNSVDIFENTLLADLPPHDMPLPRQSAQRGTHPFAGCEPLVEEDCEMENVSDEIDKVTTEETTANHNLKAKDELSDIKVALTFTAPAPKSGSTPNNNNIDRKIEEALDAVKSHLMLAVHKEVDFLKTRVSTLEGRVNELEIENSILRVNYLLFKS